MLNGRMPDDGHLIQKKEKKNSRHYCFTSTALFLTLYVELDNNNIPRLAINTNQSVVRFPQYIRNYFGTNVRHQRGLEILLQLSEHLKQGVQNFVLKCG